MSFIILDLDSTIFNIDARLPHILGKKKDWKKFRQNMYQLDRVFEPTVDIILGLLEKGYGLIILTGRSEVHRQETIEYLEELDIPTDWLIMRKKNDYTPSAEYKRKEYMKIMPTPISMVFDDHPKVIAMFREYGIPCYRPYLSKYNFEEDGDIIEKSFTDKEVTILKEVFDYERYEVTASWLDEGYSIEELDALSKKLEDLVKECLK